MKDYYEILGIPKDASLEQVKKIYRKLAPIYHPDTTVLDQAHANEKQKELNEAYTVLSDPIRRVEYDKQRERASERSAKPVPPKPQVSSTTLDFGTLDHVGRQSQTFEVDNLGGAVAEINFSYSEESSWFEITRVHQVSETEPCPLKVTVTADTQALTSGTSYSGWIEVNFDGVTAKVNLLLRVVPRPEPDPLPTRRLTAYQIPLRSIAVAAVVVLGVIVTGFLVAPLFTAHQPPMVVPMSSTAVSPSPTPQPGQIVFAVHEDGRLMLHVAQADGANDHSLGVPGWSSAWSPDGGHIALISDRSGTQQLYIVTAQGGSVTRLTDSPEEKIAPAWSPDGRRIAFIAHEPAGSELHLVDRQGSNRQTIMDGGMGDVEHFAWSPDSRQLLFDARQDGERRVYRVKADGAGLQQLVDFDSWWPAWSPDGKRVAISSEGGVYTLNENGRERLRLTTFRAWAPSWSRDGRWIAFLSDRGIEGQNPELWLMNANGRDQVRLTSSGCWGYAWSSGDEWLAYLTGDMQAQPPALQIQVVNVETREQWQIAKTSKPYLSWKP